MLFALSRARQCSHVLRRALQTDRLFNARFSAVKVPYISNSCAALSHPSLSSKLLPSPVLHRFFHTNAEQFDKHSDGSRQENNNEKPKLGMYVLALTVPLVLSAWMLYFLNNQNNDQTEQTVSWKEFIEEILPSGEVKKVFVYQHISSHTLMVELQNDATHHGEKFKGRFLRVINISDVAHVEPTIREIEKGLAINPFDKVPIIYGQFDPKIAYALLDLLLLFGLFIIVMRALSRQFSGSMGVPKRNVVPKTGVKTGVTFNDVAGNTQAKQEVMEFVYFLRDPEKYERLGAKMPRGCLLTGPPGVGKTLLAKAVATEADVPFIFKAGSDFVEMIGGLGAKRVRDLFKEAREEEPCIVYIDELDAVGGKRSGTETTAGNSEKDQTLNQILVEMDGMFSTDHNVIVMASTNRADMLDKALLRPGRFDRHIEIDLPTRAERKEIFETHLRGLKLMRPASTYTERLSKLSPGMTGADIANICNEAAIFAAREKDTHIDVKHFEYAMERILAGSARKSSSMSPDERKTIAVHEAGQTLVGWLLKYTDALLKVSMVPRTKAPIGFVQTLPTDRKLFSKKQLFDIMSMKLAGRAAENLVFGTVTQAGEKDLKKVTEIAYAQIKHMGFSPVIGNVSFAGQDEAYVKPYSESLAEVMDREAKQMIYEAHVHAEKILVNNRDKLDLLSQELLRREVLNYADIVELIGPPPHGDKAQVPHIELPYVENEEQT